MRRRSILVCAIAATACGLNPVSFGAENHIDLPAIVTKADAQTVLGEPVKDPQARNDEGADGFYSRCNYYSENPGKSLLLRVRQAGPGQLEPKKQLEEMTAGNDKFKPVTALGEKAGGAREGAGKGPGDRARLFVGKKKH